jgi:hypothetical protein
MDDNRVATVKEALGRFGLPTAAGVVGTGVGLILTRKPSTNSTGGIGNLVDDLRGKLESVIGRDDDGSSKQQQPTRRQTQNLSAKQLTARRRAREQRRKQRRTRARG